MFFISHQDMHHNFMHEGYALPSAFHYNIIAHVGPSKCCVTVFSLSDTYLITRIHAYLSMPTDGFYNRIPAS